MYLLQECESRLASESGLGPPESIGRQGATEWGHTHTGCLHAAGTHAGRGSSHTPVH